ncbi:MAG: type II toxin-antitoxin system RelE/ParE family toxin [Prevotellaceae bacterium]|jgi:mRNA interferase RelE/StbE|nr:type II toxin-antitoxin system RelE/ParE family toxin [Prevotellaceae bacterium]
MYRVVFKKSAEKDLGKLNSIYYNSVVEHIRSLSENPRPFGVTKLSTSQNAYRIRVGVYRIIYTIEDNILTVEIIKIDHRSSVYR